MRQSCLSYAEKQTAHAERTSRLEFRIAMTAAIKNVLSPISETNIMPQDLRKPAVSPPASRLVMSAQKNEQVGGIGTAGATK